MNEWMMAGVAAVAGLLLGAFFFGGLWWTVRRGLTARQPALWFFGSMLLRTAITVAGIYVVCRGHWDRTLGCLAGFVLARLVVTRMTRPRFDVLQATSKEAPHAP